MEYLLQAFIRALWWFLEALYIPLKWCLDGIFYVLYSIIYFVISGILSAVVLLIEAIDFSAVVLVWGAAYSHLPPQVTYLMISIGFPQFVAIVGSAYLVRLLINLIPAVFTRA